MNTNRPEGSNTMSTTTQDTEATTPAKPQPNSRAAKAAAKKAAEIEALKSIPTAEKPEPTEPEPFTGTVPMFFSAPASMKTYAGFQPAEKDCPIGTVYLLRSDWEKAGKPETITITVA